jgi:hypothetical protein
VTDEEREQRERELTRRAMLRAGAAVPLAVALGGIAAACGGDDGSGLVPEDTSKTKGSTTVPGQTAPGGGPVHDDFSDSGAHTDTVHTDTPHGDTPHVDGTAPPRTIHDDNYGPGGHSDGPAGHADYTDVNGQHVDMILQHADNNPHIDSTVEVPGDHEDVAHVDTPHGDS